LAEFDPVYKEVDDRIPVNSRPIDVPGTIKPTGVERNFIMPEGVKEGDRSAEYAGKAREYGLQQEGARAKSFGDLFAGIVQGANFLVNATDHLYKKDIEKQIYARTDKEQEDNVQALELIRNGPGGIKSFLDANAQVTDEIPLELENLPDTVGGLTGASGAGKISNTMYYGRILSIAKDLRAKYPG